MHRLLSLCLLIFALLFFIDGFGQNSLGLAFSFSVFLSAFAPFLMSTFWVRMASLHTHSQAARVYGIVAAGAQCGELIASVAAPLLFRLLASGGAVGRAVLTMQKEVGEKVLAPHGCKQYGILSVMLQLFAQPEAVFDIPPAAFRPMPKCTVSVLRFAPTAAPGGGAGAAWSATQREQLLALLKRTFEQRRKRLRQTLKPLLADAATPIPDDWLTKRPEQLSPLEWVELSSMVFGDSADGGDASLLRKDMQPKWSATKAGWKDNKLRPNRPAPAPE